ncbi:HNH endonuclease [Candidatus Gracilibacteria bacterium]|nr:HNH endonuclease [Candidatus Gracilibacteria bacterium]
MIKNDENMFVRKGGEVANKAEDGRAGGKAKEGMIVKEVPVGREGMVVKEVSVGKVIGPSAIGFKISDLSDEQLYKKCVECGMNAKVWVRKFVAMLPEVEKRHLYKKKGFVSIYDFAKKLAGMSDFTVDRILRLVKRIEDKPILLRQFESGKQSWSKIETVSYIATKETQEDLAKKIEILPQQALVAYVSQKRAEMGSNVYVELKNKNEINQGMNDLSREGFENENVGGAVVGNEMQLDLREIFNGVGVDGNNNSMINSSDIRREERYKIFLFHASIDVQFKLRLFKQGLEKERKQSLSWNEVFEALLRKVEGKGIGGCANGAGEKGIGGVANVAGEKGMEGCANGFREGIKEKDLNRGKPAFVKYAGLNDGENSGVKKDEENLVSRHIPVVLKRQILANYGYKCGFPKCNFPCFVLHHTRRFFLFKKHDAESIVPLCKKHHDLVHGGCIENEEDVPEKWRLKKVVGGDAMKVSRGDQLAGNNHVIDKRTGEILDTKEKVDAIVMKYKMKKVS